MDFEKLSQERIHLLRNINPTRYRSQTTEYYSSLIENGLRENDPIALQSIPSKNEIEPELPYWAKEWSLKAFKKETPWSEDPIGDLDHMTVPRLTHRYSNRAILHTSSTCAMYCRFCFRKAHLNDVEKKLYTGGFEEALIYLKEHSEIEEIILTGGDPLSLSDSTLLNLIEDLIKIENIRLIRIHTRMPVTMPSRLSDILCSKLKTYSYTKRIQFMTHFNHPKEITAYVLDRIRHYQNNGFSFLNQSVLLRNVNDSIDVLRTLFEELYLNGIPSIYLHHPDWTPGTFHFRTSIEKGLELYRSLQGFVSGPALPHYVLDLPGGFGKINLSDSTKVRILESRQDYQNHIGGAVYEVQPSCIKKSINVQSLYTDFYNLIN